MVVQASRATNVKHMFVVCTIIIEYALLGVGLVSLVLFMSEHSHVHRDCTLANVGHDQKEGFRRHSGA